MAIDKRCTAAEAVELIRDGDSIVASGFMWSTVGHELMYALGERFKKEGHPQDISFMQAAGLGNNTDQGVAEMTYEGLIKRYVTGHFANNQKMIQLANEQKIESYNFPQGVIAHMYRAAAGKKVGEITKVGLNTYVDPRYGGGKMNDCTKEDLVELIEIHGEEYLLYKAPKFDIGFIRGTTSDEYGNITMEEESAFIDALDVAMAVKANGGKVFVQVKNYVSSKSLDRSQVIIPGIFVDKIVLCSNPEYFHRQTPKEVYNPVISGHYQVESMPFETIPLSAKKVIARRAALEYVPDSVINLGIGIPEGIAAVMNEEGLGDKLVFTIESGLIGGVPLGKDCFGSAVNSWAALPMNAQFDFYDSGGLEATYLGFAEVGPEGDVNASKFGKHLAGCGGFIDLVHATKKVYFCGTFTAGGLKTKVDGGKLIIEQEGRNIKFRKDIMQKTFSGKDSFKKGMRVQYITERCVLELAESGLILTEIAPGIDMENDIFAHMEFKPSVAENLKVMDARLFKDELMNLKEDTRR